MKPLYIQGTFNFQLDGINGLSSIAQAEVDILKESATYERIAAMSIALSRHNL